MLLSNQALTGYVEEPYVALRELWQLIPASGEQTVYVKFVDQAGNISDPVADTIALTLLSPDTVITGGPAGLIPQTGGTFTYLCPEGDCVFSYAVDHDAWSNWSSETSVTITELAYGNHYFRVKAAKDTNGTPGIQSDEEDASPAERTWIVGSQPPIFTVPQGPPIKLWRLD